MPAVVTDSSVLITLAAGEQLLLLRGLYGVIYAPQAVWDEVTAVDRPFGVAEPRQARALGIRYTGTLGVLLRGKAEGKLAALRPVLALMQLRTTFWIADDVRRAVLVQSGENEKA